MTTGTSCSFSDGPWMEMGKHELPEVMFLQGFRVSSHSGDCSVIPDVVPCRLVSSFPTVLISIDRLRRDVDRLPRHRHFRLVSEWHGRLLTCDTCGLGLHMMLVYCIGIHRGRQRLPPHCMRLHRRLIMLLLPNLLFSFRFHSHQAIAAAMPLDRNVCLYIAFSALVAVERSAPNSSSSKS